MSKKKICVNYEENAMQMIKAKGFLDLTMCIGRAQGCDENTICVI